MTPQADDFKADSEALAALLAAAPDETFRIRTQFKSWTIDDVIAHLHLWNHAAMLTLENREAFQAFFTDIAQQMMAGKSHVEIQRAWLGDHEDGAHGKALLERWLGKVAQTAHAYREADPQARLAWAGPEMSARAAIIARQMETWAHGQAVFDILGQTRAETDRVRNICHLGVTTYSWSFRNQGEEPPRPKPYVRLTAPSGAVWEWNDPQDDNAVSGPAAEFAQVAAQTRNIADTSLRTAGDAAARWMATAQCFAGPPERPPAKGTRFRVEKRQ